MARQASIKRKLDHGWALGGDGLLVKGEGRQKVEVRPTTLMSSKSGERDFNPHHDAFAVRLGGEFEGPNRYRVGAVLVDANGACRDEAECPECGSINGEYRFMVRVEDERREAKPWESLYTCCMRCCTEVEIAAFETQAAAPAKRGGRG
jgi:hypothetical protein